MKTWNEVVNDKLYAPEYMEVVLGDVASNYSEIVNGLFFDGIRLDFDSVPKGWFAYSIRHSDFDMCVPGSLEKYVLVNFMGTILFDHEIDLTEKGWLQITDYAYKDWTDVATEELSGNGIDVSRIDFPFLEHWENLKPINYNVAKISEQLLL